MDTSVENSHEYPRTLSNSDTGLPPLSILALLIALPIFYAVIGTSSLALPIPSNVATSVTGIDLEHGIPSAPGGFFYLFLIKLLSRTGLAINHGMLWVNVIAAPCALYVFWKLASKWADRDIAYWSILLLGCNCFLLFHASVAEYTSPLILWEVATVLLLSAEDWTKKQLGAVIFGLSAGINVLGPILLLPFLVYSVLQEQQWKKRFTLSGEAIIGVLAWLVTIAFFLNGSSLDQYLSQGFSGIDLQSNPVRFALLALAGCNVLIPFLFTRSTVLLDTQTQLQWWLVPAFLFNLLVHVSVVSFALFLAPAVLFTVLRIAATKRAMIWVYACALAGILIFFFLPLQEPEPEQLIAEPRREAPVSLTSHFFTEEAPAYCRSHFLETVQKEGLALLRQIAPEDSIVVLTDPSTTFFLSPMNLWLKNPAIHVAYYTGEQLNLLRYADGSTSDLIKSATDTKCLYYLANRKFVQQYLSQSVRQARKVGETEHLTLYDFTNVDRRDLLDHFLFYFYHARPHHQ